MSENIGLYAKVHGKVQGVGFRYSTLSRARRLKLTGYVKNLWDGGVEVLAEGPEDTVLKLVSWLKKGPPGSYVTKLDQRRVPYSGTFRVFTIDY